MSDQELTTVNLAEEDEVIGTTRATWEGSDTTQAEIDWLIRTRRIPEGVIYRQPGPELEPVLQPGEYVVFVAHFERGFGLPVSNFMRQFLNNFHL